MDFITEELKHQFAGQFQIAREELFDFYRSFEQDLKEATFSWRIHSLKEKNILKSVKKGIYTLLVKPEFHPQIEPRLKEIASKITKHFPEVRYSVWSTRWLNDMMIHQPGRFLFLVEVEAIATESIFYFLKDENYKNVFLEPDDNMLERYVYEQKESIIVKSLTTKAPIQIKNKIFIPTPEKILVDLFIDKKLYLPFQGSELIQIYNNTYRQYALNTTRLLAYARRRAKDNDLQDYIKRNSLFVESKSE